MVESVNIQVYLSLWLYKKMEKAAGCKKLKITVC